MDGVSEQNVARLQTYFGIAWIIGEFGYLSIFIYLYIYIYINM